MLVVGIDLGTTNSCLAWAEGDSEVMVFGVPQLVPTGRERRALLPSMLYAPVVGEDAHEPWCEPPWITGELARARGLEVPGRAVTSAKSWLCHPTSDPTEPSLPAAKTAGTPTLSAVDASARVLRHLVRAFEESTGHSLRSACVVLTVPASFDESARAYTLEAARRARLSPKLLEEPQAAFYDYMGAGDGRSLRDLTARGGGRARVLVVDVGGGTTDLSFISVEDRKGAIHVERIATGDHLLLGGDNMDLALAAEVRARLGVTFDPAREGQLVLACRAAKEALLSDRPPERFPIAVAGKGSRIVGRVTRAEITREDAERVVVEGFFPKVARGAVPRVSRAGLVSTGLPFARDPAITRHVAQFLEKYAGGELPDAVLLNGGVFRAKRLRSALTDVIGAWTHAPVCILQESHPDLAVARGAVAYGRLREAGAPRIVAGAARSYYVGAAYGGRARGVCVVPRGTPEGALCEVRGVPLKLRTGAPGRFDLYRAETGAVHAVGEIVDVTGREYARLRPLVAHVPGTPGEVDVELAGELSPVGTLALSLREVGGKARSFSLEFTVRSAEAVAPAADAAPPVNRAKLDAAVAQVERAFAWDARDGRAVKDLVRDLERILGDRFGWHMHDARVLFDAVLAARGARRWSEPHERVFWLLAGFCLRPGFGAEGDRARLRSLFELWSAMLVFPERAPPWQAFFIAWRRVAGGLDEAAQTRLRDALDPHLGLSHRARPVKGARPPRPLAPVELAELASFLERVDPERKVALGDVLALAARQSPRREDWLAVSRVGARVLTYGEARFVVPRECASRWAEDLLATTPLEHPAAREAIVRLARVSSTSEHDLPPALRRAIAQRLRRAGASERDVHAVTSYVPLSRAERASSFGDALPVGLVLGD
ncbi:MAG: Hsp70 family protein [Myxococcales bacterium]|jgi:molecular chaperone DnaK (HSP70)|nr:Hsp70 family protein [Myxococcales bacterium]